MSKSTKSKRGPGRPAGDRTPILVALLQAGEPQTAKDLGISPVLAGRMVERERLIQVKGTRRAEGPGRPANLFTLTRKGRDRARKASAQATA